MNAETIAQNIAFTAFAASRSFEKMTAQVQRELFGKAIFGKKSIRWNGRRIETRVTTISRDYDITDYTLEEVAELVNAGKYAERGWNGYNYQYGRTAK